MKYWRTRKYREKALALMVALAMVLSLFPGLGGVALATKTAVVEAGSATVAHDAAGADRTVDIPVDITVNPGLCSYTLEIGYNGSALTLNSITQGTAVVGSFLSNISFGPGKARVTSTRATNDTGVGSLFTLNFTVADSAAAGDYLITAGVANDDPENFCTVNEEEEDPLKQVAALPVTFIPGKITVTAPPAAAQAPVFETDLSAGPVTYSAGGTAVALTVEASVTDGGEITYQWYSNSVNSTEGGSEISGATEASYTPSTAGIGTTYYYVIATNTLEGGAASATSSVAAVTVEIVNEEPATGQVRVIVENTTYPVSAGAPWDGALVDTWVNIDEESTMMNCVVAALDTVGATQKGAESSYITSVNGLEAFDGGFYSGWMGTLNDWFTNEGFGAFAVIAGTLEAGDEIRIMYTVDYGEDLGGSWDNNDKTVKALSFSEGTLAPQFDKDTHEYTLTVPQGTTGVVVTPTASNKNFQVRAGVEGSEYKRSATVPIEDGTVITVKCGEPAWPSMNNQAGGTAAGVPAEVYTITVQAGTPDHNPALASLTLANGESGAALTLSPAFSADTLEYTASTENVASVKVTPAAVSPTASIQVNGEQVASGSASDAIALTGGGADINVAVTDGDLSRTYTIAVIAQVDPYIVITHDSAGGKVQEYSYLDNKDRILVYDCAYDEFETAFKATAYPEGSGEARLRTLLKSTLYSFNAETGVLKLTSKADGVKASVIMVATSPTVTTAETFVFLRALKQTVPKKVEMEVPEAGSDYTYTLDIGSTYMDYGGMSWEFPENDFFTGTTADSSPWKAQITPKRPGTADIYVTDVLTETRVKVQVTVTGKTRVVTEHGGRAEAKLAGNGNPAENLQLLAYSGLKEDTFIWTSDDENIATVDQNGLVTPKKVGTVMISAQSDGIEGIGKSAGIQVLVRADGARYLDALIFAPGTRATTKFVPPLVFEPTVLEYRDLLCPEGDSGTYYGGLYVFPTFDSENIEASLLYTDADGKTTEAILSNGSQTVINDCLQAGENEITINLTENSSGRVTSYQFIVTRPLSLVNTINAASLKPVHREAADYPQFILPVEVNKPLTTLTREGEIYHVYSFGSLDSRFYADNYTAVLNDVETIDISFTKSMPQESVIRMINQASGAIYTEDQFGNIPLNENGDTVFDVEVMSGKTAAVNPGEFIAENTSYTLTVYKLDLPPVDMGGVYFTSADFSDGCILFTPPAAFDPQTNTSVKLLIPNQGDSWVDVTLPEDAELYLGSVLPENKVTASEGVFRILLEPDSVTAILALEVDGYLCEKHYTFDIMRRGALATPDRVADYLCAPSQYTNVIGDYGGSPEGTLLGSGVSTYYSVKSLGNFGGYITYYYEDAIKNSPNNPYGVDFIVYANSNGGQGFSEPGNVLVSQDGITWYSLAGSDHFDDNVIWNYPVTYTKQADGQAAYSHAYGTGVWRQYPDWNNYPLTENRGDSFTLTAA